MNGFGDIFLTFKTLSRPKVAQAARLSQHCLLALLKRFLTLFEAVLVRYSTFRSCLATPWCHFIYVHFVDIAAFRCEFTTYRSYYTTLHVQMLLLSIIGESMVVAWFAYL